MLSFASVPLYTMFCQVTGYGGTVMRAFEGARRVSDRELTIRFNADVNPELPWEFKPLQKSIKLKAGETGLAYYGVENRADKPIVGIAIYNVTPLKAGSYFNKIECFCFDDRMVVPNNYSDLPVTFFIDPDIDKDPNMKDVNTITLSYTFYRSHNQDLVEHYKPGGTNVRS